jgi:dinuclear metal center YbgI/SA1388 family protein
MQISEIINFLETFAPTSLQESYDNAGLLTGMPEWECTGAMVSLDITDEVINEAIQHNCNLLIAHHPLIFKGLKRINGKDPVSRNIIKAIKNDLAIYAIHTNLDNVLAGVNGKMADKLGLINRRVLQPKAGQLKKLVVFVPEAQAALVRQAIFEAGGGHIGNYSECSFSSSGTGTFKGGAGSNPFVGEVGIQHQEPETKVEVVVPAWMAGPVVKAMLQAHPYEEVAYDIISLENTTNHIGSGLIGELPQPVDETAFLEQLQGAFGLKVLRHTPLLGKTVQKIALCGGAGSFLTRTAIAAGADAYITGDVKYHEFFDADGRLLLADIGHYESEQFTIDLLFDVLQEKFPTFAVLKTGVNTNPVLYFPNI